MDKKSEFLTALGEHDLVPLATTQLDPQFCDLTEGRLVLIGPRGGSDWWNRVTASPEWQDNAPDPLDRWSKRVLADLAARFNGAALFPSDGPPWPPFFRWAIESNQIWQSPVGMLVHASSGLWVSFRGALALPFQVTLPQQDNPCLSCVERPCVTACPVNALSASAYDTQTCHAHLDTPKGADCLNSGCRARRACPVSQSHARLAQQSAYHMSRFHP